MGDAQGLTRNLRRALLPSLSTAFALMAALDAVNQAPAILGSDGDPALHMLLGQIILAKHSLPASDPTSVVTSTLPLIDHEWLSQVLLGGAEHVLGLAGPVLVSAALVALMLALAVRETRRLGVQPWTVLAVFAPAYLTLRAHLLVRPHLVSWLLDVVVFVLLDRYRTGALGWRRLTLVGVVLFALWANLHGGFVVGLVFVALFVASELLGALGGERQQRRERLRGAGRMALSGVAFGLATLANPYGWRLHLALFHFFHQSFLFKTTTDLAPPRLSDAGAYLLFALLIGTFVVLLAGRRRVPLFHWLVVTALAVMTLRSRRAGSLFSPIAAIAVAPCLQALLDRAAESPRRWGAIARAVAASNTRLDRVEREAGGAALVAVTALALIIAGDKRALPARFDPGMQPVRAAHFVDAHPAEFRGQMYNAFVWGGYLAWHFYPRRLVYLHGFNFEYGTGPQRAYMRVFDADKGYEKVLDDARASWVLWPADTPLASALQSNPCWKRAYDDPLAVIFVRKQAAHCAQGS